jgi:hypothetical protein
MRYMAHSFPASSSSLSNALWRTRSCQGHGLHNTRLEPPHPLVPRLPVDGVPGSFECGECTSRWNRCHLPSLLRRLIKLSCDERPDGRLPAFAWGDVAIGSTPIHPTTGWPSLLPSSHARTSMGLPYGLLSLKGRHTGLPCSAAITNEWVRRALSTGSVECP